MDISRGGGEVIQSCASLMDHRGHWEKGGLQFVQLVLSDGMEVSGCSSVEGNGRGNEGYRMT